MLEVLKLSARQFPDFYAVFERLGKAQLESGEIAQGRANLQRSIDLNKRSYPWEVTAYDETKKILSGEKEYPPKAVKVDPKIYDAYVGEYESALGLLYISRDGDKLFGQPAGQTRQELVPQTETQFSAPAVRAQVTFVKDSGGQVRHLILRIDGQDLQAKKIK